MKILTTTNYNGRLHLGYGEENSAPNCLGKSINIYRNFITKFFTKLFGFSFEIEINGKQRCLNKKSLIKHLRSIGLNTNIENIKKNGYKEELDKTTNVKINKEILGRNFSSKKQMKLFKKMIKELDLNNTQAVKKLIRKGASVEREFFMTNAFSKRLWMERRPLEEALAYNFEKVNFSKYTPFVLALEKKNQDIIEYIHAIKKDHSSDIKQTFCLENINYVNSKTTIIKEEAVISDNNSFKLYSS